MNHLQNMQWKRLSIETFAIIASILLAFAIDAWWENRQRSTEEHFLLESLLVELKDKKILLENDRKYNGAIRDSVIALINAGNDVNSKLTQDDIDSLIADTWWYNTSSEWGSVALNTLVAGNNTIISNLALMSKFEKLEEQISRIRKFYELDESFHHMIYTPYLVEYAYLPQIIQQVSHYPGRPELAYQQPQFNLSSQQDHRILIKRKDFQNMMVAKLDRMLDILINAYRYIDVELNDSILLLEQELNLD